MKKLIFFYSAVLVIFQFNERGFSNKQNFYRILVFLKILLSSWTFYFMFAHESTVESVKNSY